jgi:hypothetical protein
VIVNVKSNGETECMLSVTELRAVIKDLPATDPLIGAREVSMADDSGIGVMLTFRATPTVVKSIVDASTGAKS